ncbi:MAG: tetratricopeptide repeat protein [Candidatus Eisenbacteria bacterium]
MGPKDEPRDDEPLDPATREAAEAASDPDFEGWDGLVSRSAPELAGILGRLRDLQEISRRHARPALACREELDCAHAGGESGAHQADALLPDGSANLGGRGPLGGTVPVTWGPLVLREKVGEGANGVTYRPFDPRLQREVALKLQVHSAGPSEPSLAEARRLARVRHPNVLSVHGADNFDGLAGIWTDLLQGETLEEKLLRDGPFGESETSIIGIDLCRGLSAVHRAGLVHGDVKAANVMSEDDGSIVLLDFGSGRTFDLGAGAPEGTKPLVDTESRISGTPLALAPEVFSGDDPNPRTDIYALGTLLYRLSTGRYPIPAETIDELIERHRRGTPVSFRDAVPTASDAFAAVVDRCLAADPGLRFGDVREVEEALSRVPFLASGGLPDQRRATCPNNVPRAISSFVGRRGQVAEIAERTRNHRLVTLTGVGGAGKTRIAVVVATRLLVGRFREVRFAELASVRQEDRVPATVGAALASSSRVPATGSRRSSAAWRIGRSCSSWTTASTSSPAPRGSSPRSSDAVPNSASSARVGNLSGSSGSSSTRYLLSNFLLSGDLLSIAILSNVLCVGTRGRNVAGRRSEASTSESVALFVERARDVGNEIDLSVDGDRVAEICSRLDGNPLAIELAAARTRALTLAEIHTRLDDRFRLLSSRDAREPRHQTLTALIDWSHELLDDAETVLFRRFAVFLGGATLEAVEVICAGGSVDRSDVLDLVSRLVERHLLELDRERSRYRMLETIHVYAKRKLEESGETADVLARYREYFAGLTNRARESVRGEGEALWIRRYHADVENVRSALHSAPEDGSWTSLAPFEASFVYLCAMTGSWKEGAARGARALERGASAPSAQPRPDRCDLLRFTASLYLQLGQIEQAQAWLEEALRLAQSLGDRRRLHATYGVLGNLARNRGEFERALELHSEALEIATDIGDPMGIRIELTNLGGLHRQRGDDVLARSHHETVIEAARSVGDRRSAAYSLCVVGYLDETEDRLDRAHAAYDESLQIRRELGDRWGVAASLTGLAGVLRRQANYAGAASLIEEALEILHEMGDRISYVRGLTNLALVRFEQKNVGAELSTLREIFMAAPGAGAIQDLNKAFELLATVLMDDGRLDLAASVLSAETSIRDAYPPAIHAEVDRTFGPLKTRLRELTGEETIPGAERGDAPGLGEAVQTALDVIERVDSTSAF